MDFERDLFGIGHQGLEEERRQVGNIASIYYNVYDVELWRFEIKRVKAELYVHY